MMWLIMALLVLLAAGFVIYPLLREPVQNTLVTITSANVILFNERLAEFDGQLADGHIDDNQYGDLVSDQQLLLLADEPENANQKASGGRGAWLLLTCLPLLPLLAFSLYRILGASDDVVISELLKSRANEPTEMSDLAVKQQLENKISRRLRSQPDNIYYWLALARLHMEESDFSQASVKYQKAVSLSPNDSNLLAEYAQAVYFRDGDSFEGGAGAVLDNALALDPDNLTALGLQGIRFFESGDHQKAIASWQAALRAIDPGTPQAQALESGVARAREELGEVLPSVEVRVTLSPELVISQGAVVFVYAREWQGTPMPLAVAKLQVEDLPTTVRLDDSMAMPGGKLLSSVDKVEVMARVSINGSATPAEGDFEGSADAFILGDQAEVVAVVIDRKL
ncbi:MAG: cytochrome c-type biogenesis protein CcmH [Porticoccus sp.]|jgi:cytochrome c-type biogenesis protein CcmH